MKSCWVILMAVLANSLAWAAPTHLSRYSQAQILKKYSYFQIGEVSNYFNALEEADPMPKDKKLLRCDPSIDIVRDVGGGQLHALSDASRIPLVEKYLKNPAAMSKDIKNCRETCRCRDFALVLADADLGSPPGPVHDQNKADLDIENKKEADAPTLKCAKPPTWFCGSALQKYLY